MHHAKRLFFLGALAALWPGCGNEGDVPYGPYGYPGPCGSDINCPAGTYCVEPAPGACLVACQRDNECGPGYACRSLDSRGAKGKVLVCTSP